jgi:hypothetical protein
MSQQALPDFVGACGSAERTVFVLPGASSTARSDFGLNTEGDILGFVANGGLESPKHIRTALWEKNPHPDQPVSINSFGFFSGTKFGYIAFGFVPKTRKWILKSLKKNEQPDPRNLTLLYALQKAGLIR